MHAPRCPANRAPSLPGLTLAQPKLAGLALRTSPSRPRRRLPLRQAAGLYRKSTCTARLPSLLSGAGPLPACPDSSCRRAAAVDWTSGYRRNSASGGVSAHLPRASPQPLHALQVKNRAGRPQRKPGVSVLNRPGHPDLACTAPSARGERPSLDGSAGPSLHRRGWRVRRWPGAAKENWPAGPESASHRWDARRAPAPSPAASAPC